VPKAGDARAWISSRPGQQILAIGSVGGDRAAAMLPAGEPTTLQSANVKRLPPSARPAFAGCVLSVSELETPRQMARGLTYAQPDWETRRK
jgi:hypothetical protein